MFGSSRQDPAVVVLRDADGIAASLRQALADAEAGERPGLERALALAEEAAAVPEAELRVRWTRRRLAAAGFDGPLDSVEAVRALRTAERRLGLRQAVALTKEAAAAEPSAGKRPGG
ncbi:hypothetical protein CUT44_16755 [Streptomyces carminius]|uniref:Uncharacterized protein n=1 Tax=Streptomyces carminius TaxID=2665496 RepID=A0A2M8LXI7_9ACTN|nr:hypothetical protein [Streptomyces carminius]PJE96687.1 hypothetical protein CUT44_16755 [Streptomyces carminius]